MTLSAALAFGMALNASALPVETCGRIQQLAGQCDTSGTSDGSAVTVVGTIGRNDHGPGAGDSETGPVHQLTDAELLALFDDICEGDGHCEARNLNALNPVLPPGVAGTPTAADPAVAITIRDLARFLPATASLRTEPTGWAVVGVPANFWTDVSAVTVDGSLLGETAEVRFTPRAYRFDYGDGTTRSTATAGSSWAALGEQELTATPTSHVYTERADRRASVTVIYSAEYRFAGGPWIGVTGAVSGTTPPQRMLVVVERTALTTLG